MSGHMTCQEVWHVWLLPFSLSEDTPMKPCNDHLDTGLLLHHLHGLRELRLAFRSPADGGVTSTGIATMAPCSGAMRVPLS